MFAVSLVLLLIIISAQFVRYLAEAAAGEIDAGVLITLMAFRLPEYLELILPLGLFIGIMMAYGRLHIDSEMTVLSACGFSERRMLFYTLVTSAIVAVIVAIFSLYLGPHGVRASESLLAEQRNRTDFETLKPARFYPLDTGTGVSYAESISEDRQRLNNVFMAQVTTEDKSPPTILMAESGETIVDTERGEKYLLLKNGKRYVGRPGEGEYEIVSFKQYAQRLPDSSSYDVKPKKETDGMTTASLWVEQDPVAKAALSWRLSLPLLVMIVGMMAVPLSRTQPRKGRYGKLVPAILIYMSYLVAANSARGLSEGGEAPIPGLLWYVHGLYFVVACVMFFWPQLRSFVHRNVWVRGTQSARVGG